MLDAYAGTGALGIEALRRGASWVDFIEADERRCRDIRQTLKDMDMNKQARVYKGKVERSFDRLQGGYDVVFADPPYDQDPWDEFLGRFGYADLLKSGARVVAEHRNKTELRDSYGRLKVESRRTYGDTAVTFFRMGKNDG